ncbi:biotin transporter BioY [Gloeobacter kilaueensis]|uniref:BioY protein n=1 Tax=Gloeobacter kilaueensis (strain ATCC BAA-2537 / CCAP 1431/1 / ULC 316 / JS1) TaxID=1183438 RepID=U5QR15_GLOK1|nr:biotin transporter BioY [Gloeobacter kilaueensis]AGY60160.1 BioY protein [Gloeobacter kilaueensis JS1]
MQFQSERPIPGIRATLGLPLPRRRWLPLPTIVELIWAVVGLVLTVGGTLCHLQLPDRFPQMIDLAHWPPALVWHFEPGYPFSLQVAAVLLSGLIGGPVAAGLAQSAYLTLGFAGFPVFAGGGGIEYLAHPQSGYLLAFVPAAVLCGALAFRCRSSLNWLATSALAGLAVIHLGGIVGLLVHLPPGAQLGGALVQYSLLPLLGQAIGVLLVASGGWVIRRLLLS